MAKKNSTTMRVDPNFKKMVDEILKEKPRDVKTPRITLAMYRQYIKDPLKLKELKKAKLK